MRMCLSSDDCLEKYSSELRKGFTTKAFSVHMILGLHEMKAFAYPT